MGSRVRIRLFHILHFVMHFLFLLLKNSKSGVDDRGHRLRSGSPVTNLPGATAITRTSCSAVFCRRICCRVAADVFLVSVLMFISLKIQFHVRFKSWKYTSREILSLIYLAEGMFRNCFPFHNFITHSMLTSFFMFLPTRLFRY